MDWIELPKQRSSSGTELDGEGEYAVVSPGQLYRGRSYSDLASDWLNWFLSADADKRSSGPVVFLRSKGLPNEKIGANISDNPSLAGERSGESPESASIDVPGMTDYSKPYVNDPNIRVGGDRLQIFEDQAVFVPIIVAFSLKMSPFTDWGSMQDFTGLTIDYGDNPPDISQLTINGREIDIPIPEEIFDQEIHVGQSGELLRDEDKSRLADLGTEGGLDEKETKRVFDQIRTRYRTAGRGERITIARELRLMEYFRITTPIFTAIVPETQYGRSAKDFIEESPVAAGSYPAMVDGYFVLCKFRAGNYWVHSWASGPREASGPYFSELLYQIEVHARRDQNNRVTKMRPLETCA